VSRGRPKRRKRPARGARRPAAPKRAARRPAGRPAPAKRRPAATRTPTPDLGALARAFATAATRRAALERLLSEARQLTRAEAGTVYLREGNALRFAVVQNDALVRRLGRGAFERRLSTRPLPLTRVSIAAWVALTQSAVNLPAVHDYPLDRPYAVDRRFDRRLDYQTRSMLALPLRDAAGAVMGVLQLINALDRRGRIVSFDRAAQTAVLALADATTGRAPVRA
jgi:GAF domain-containing protein